MTGHLFLPLLCLILHATCHIVVSASGEGVSIVPSKMRNLESRIVGGTQAVKTRYPYYTQLSITFYNGFWITSSGSCGGTLIATDVVLTAAHCLVSRTDSVWSIDTWVNSTGFFDSPYGYYRSASRFLVHPSYNRTFLSNDIALIFLDEPVTGVTLAKINKAAASPAVNKDLTAIGLGHLKSPPVVKATDLMEVSMKTLSGTNCSNLYGAAAFKNANHICAGTTSKNICQGDSGGPLLIRGASAGKDVQVGLTSYTAAAGCALAPSGFTRVSKYATWIESSVCLLSAYKPSTCK